MRHIVLSCVLFVLACDPSPKDDGLAADGEESTETDTETGDGGGVECGDTTCASGEYCDWLDNKCGTVPDTSTCRPNAENCPADEPVCGCDGQVYDSACEANAAGTDVGEFTCEPPAERFECGTRLCSLEAELCEHIPSGGFAPASVWTCLATPPECEDDWSCACILPLYEQQASCLSPPECIDGGDVGVRIECDQGV